MKKKITLFSVLTLLFLLALPGLGAYKLSRAIPSDIYLTKDKNIEINVSGFVSAVSKENPDCSAASGKVVLSCPENSSYNVDLKLFGIVPVKTLTVSSSDSNYYIPSGRAIGIKLYTDGVLVIALSENLPAEEAGIQVGDVITHINGTKVLNASHFSSLLTQNKQALAVISFMRGNTKHSAAVSPIYSENEYKIGAWVRDSSAGIGTLTYVDQNQSFGALGHGICDVDTGDLLTVMHGSITDCEIIDTVKGKKGSAGKLCAVLKGSDTGIIAKNTDFGIYGQTDSDKRSAKEAMPIATRFEIHEGEATILSTIDSGGPKEYSVCIEKINTADTTGASMEIKVTDENLISKTGGIVQGM